MAIRYVVSESERSFAGDEWQVTGVNHDSEGEVYLAFFTGHDAKGLAIEYATLKNRLGGANINRGHAFRESAARCPMTVAIWPF